MRIVILGCDGYLGWPLTLHLINKGYEVIGVDSLLRRKMVKEVGSESLSPILSFEKRQKLLGIPMINMDISLEGFLPYILRKHRPEAIVHLAEIPSAPYSMISERHAVLTQVNNVIGTLRVLWAMRKECPKAHLLKIGSMGEYGTPNMPIPEGSFEVEYKGYKDWLPFPKQAFSFYHLSKAFDSQNINFACKAWGLRASDLNQGIVYGINPYSDERYITRYDYDAVNGTIINRFSAQAVIGHPLTIYGKGGQTRGVLSIRDSIECLTLAIENPVKEGEYRVFNQFGEIFSINELAEVVMDAAQKLGYNSTIEYIENPRVEKETHFYEPSNEGLRKLGYKPRSLRNEIHKLLTQVAKYRKRIIENVFLPEIKW